MSDTKLTAEESCRQVLKSIADACDQESLARADGYLFRYVQEETVLRDCGQRGVCRTPPGCARHWEERNLELVRENAALRAEVERLEARKAERCSRRILWDDGCCPKWCTECGGSGAVFVEGGK